MKGWLGFASGWQIPDVGGDTVHHWIKWEGKWLCVCKYGCTNVLPVKSTKLKTLAILTSKANTHTNTHTHTLTYSASQKASNFLEGKLGNKYKKASWKMIMALRLLRIYSKGKIKDMPKDLASKVAATSILAQNQNNLVGQW